MNYFKTDGIRENITLEFSYKLGCALKVFKNDFLLISYDGRKGSVSVAKEIYKGAKRANIRAYLVEMLPTSFVMYESLSSSCLGVMVTASHNPYYDLGIKVFLRGRKLSRKMEEELSLCIDNEIYKEEELEYDYIDIKDNYLKFIDSYISKTSLKIMVDFSNGALSKVGHMIFDKISDSVIYLCDNPNGVNINEGCGSLNPLFIKEKLIEYNYDLGFSFDGDGDRVIVVSKDKIYDGDDILALLSNSLKISDVVFTKYSNLGLRDYFNKKEINYYISNPGDRNVVETMEKYNVYIGGEISGHIIFNILPFSCGVLTAIMFLNNYDKSFISFNKYPKFISNIKVKDKTEVLSKLDDVLESIKQDNKDVYIYVRPSGTEDYIRVYVSSLDMSLCNTIGIMIEDEILLADGKIL